MLYQYPLKMRFKLIALAPQIVIRDANDQPILFVRQKILNLREDVQIFRDETKAEEVFRIKADRIIDIGARYSFYDSKTERSLGSIKQRGLKTIWSAHYDIEAPTGDVTHDLTEDNPWIKVLDSLLLNIPIVGMFSGYFFNPSFTVKDGSGNPILQLKKQASFFENQFEIHNLAGELSPEVEKRLILSIMMMVQLNRSRG